MDVVNLKKECQSLTWGDVSSIDSIDNKVDILGSKLVYLFEKCVPLKSTSKKRKPCPWINFGIKQIMKQRDSLYKRYLCQNQGYSSLGRV